MPDLINVRDLNRAFVGFVHNPDRDFFSLAGADFQSPQDMSSLSRLARFKNWIAGMFSGNRDVENARKRDALDHNFNAIADAILFATTDKNASGTFTFVVNEEEFTIARSDHDGTQLSIRHGRESLPLDCTLAELKSAMLKTYIVEQRATLKPGEKISLSGCDLRNIDFLSEDFSDCDFDGALLENAVFIACSFRNSEFTSTNLTNSIFRSCDMDSTEFTDVDLAGAYLRDLEMTNAKFVQTDLSKTSLIAVNLADATFLSTDGSPVVATESRQPASLPGGTIKVGTDGSIYSERIIDPRYDHHFSVILDQLATKVLGQDKSLDAALCKLLVHFSRIEGHATAADWAKISLDLEHILKTSVAWKDGASNKVNWATTAEALGHLESISRLNWAQLAHDAIVSDMAAHYTKKFDLGHTDFTATNFSAGYGPLQFLSLGGAFNYKTGTVVDDEGFVGEVALRTGMASAEASITSDNFFNLGAKTSLSTSRSRGDYIESNSGEHYSQVNFKRLVTPKNFLADKIRRFFGGAPTHLYARHLNRAAETCPALAGVDLRPEVADIRKMAEDYEKQREKISRFFSLTLNANFAKITEKDLLALGLVAAPASEPKSTSEQLKSERLPLRFAPHAEKPNEPFRADMTVTSGTWDAVVGDTTALTSFNKPATGGLSIVPSFGVEAGLTKTSLRFVRNTSPVSKLTASFEKYKKSTGVDDKDRANEQKKILGAHEKFKAAAELMQKNLQANWESAHYFGADSQQAILFRTLDFGTHDLASFETFVKRLDEDFTEYARLQKQMQYGDQEQTKASLDLFHKLYGVKNAEELIACMTVLNGYFFSSVIKSNLDDVLDADGKMALGLCKKFSNFETRLMSEPFPVDMKKVHALCAFKTDAHLNTVDTSVKFLINVPVSVTGSSSSISVTVSRRARAREHVHIFRGGNDVEYSIDCAAALSPLALKYIAEKMAKRSDVGDAATALNTYCSAGGQLAVGHTLSFRYYTSSFFSPLGERFLFWKQAARLDWSRGVNASRIPIGHDMNVSFAAGVDSTKSSLIKMRYGANTLFQFGLIYTHEFSAGCVEGTALLPEDCYWNTVKREQRSVLEQIFTGMGAPGNVEEAERGIALRTEISVVIERLAATSGNYKEVKSKLDEKAAELYKAAILFGQATAREEKEASFTAAVIALENLFRLYYPQIKTRKGDFAVYTERDLDLSAVSAVVKAPPRQAATKPIQFNRSGYMRLPEDERNGETPEKSQSSHVAESPESGLGTTSNEESVEVPQSPSSGTGVF